MPEVYIEENACNENIILLCKFFFKKIFIIFLNFTDVQYIFMNIPKRWKGAF